MVAGMKELELYRAAIRRLPSGASEAEAQAEREDILAVSVSGGKPAGSSASDQTTLFVRATGKKTGLAVTQRIEGEPAAAALERALENSRYSAADGPEPMNGPSGEQVREAELAHSEPEALKTMAAELEQRLARNDRGLAFSRVSLAETIRSSGVVNSRGLDIAYSRRTVEASVALVREGASGHFAYDGLMSARTPEGISAEYFLAAHRHWAETQLPPVSCPAGSYRAVIGAPVVCNILLTAWQIFSAPFYMSGNTPLAGRLGEKLFSDAVSVQDLPAAPESGYQYPFDCEGSAGKPFELVAGGRAAGLLHTLASARATGARATGNAGRKTLLSGTLHTNVLAMPKNFRLLAGQPTRDELLRGLGNGLYVNASYDEFHSVNIASGAFAIPCRAVAVKNGRMAGIAGGLTMNGNILDLFSSVEAVADDLCALPMAILKSYTVSAPSVLVSRLAISG
ncbi:MAG: TldD/PmbA family protein [Clostridiales bacterium]|jgi:PmbA protein|nr:TldD/PmbA family protein [Clostridiales bacterium]